MQLLHISSTFWCYMHKIPFITPLWSKGLKLGCGGYDVHTFKGTIVGRYVPTRK